MMNSTILYGAAAEHCFWAGYTYGTLSVLSLALAVWLLYRLLTKWRYIA